MGCVAQRDGLVAILEFPQYATAAFANRRVLGIFTHMNGVIPASLALLAIGLRDDYGRRTRAVPRFFLFQCDGGNNEQIAEPIAMPRKHRIYRFSSDDLDLRFERLADLLGVA